MNQRTGHRIGSAFALAWLIMLAFQIQLVAAGARGHEAAAGAVIGALLAFAAIYTWFWVRVARREDSLAGTVIAVGGCWRSTSR